jgi:hypothetical protein
MVTEKQARLLWAYKYIDMASLISEIRKHYERHPIYIPNKIAKGK